METKIEHIAKTSAEDISIGFDYQYYYFLNILINLKEGQSVGLEVMDDVSTKLANNIQILMQLKHTIQKRADGEMKNLTTLDIDLWKSLSNWCQVICDEVAGRESEFEQIAFIENTYFLLVTNKSENKNNELLSSINEFQQEKLSYEDLIIAIEGIKKTTQNVTIESYIETVLKLSKNISNKFFKNLKFDLGCKDIIQQCKQSIREHHIDDSRINDVFSDLDSQLRSNNYFKVEARSKIIISFDEFRCDYRRYFDKARNHKLIYRDIPSSMPDKLEDQVFIKQLLDIEDIKPTDIEAITEFTRQRLYIINNIAQWHQDGEITKDDIRKFEDEAKLQWRNKFRKAYRGNTSKNKIKQIANEIVDHLREKKLSLIDQELPTNMSNGSFYELSNKPEIGWQEDWEKKYNESC